MIRARRWVVTVAVLASIAGVIGGAVPVATAHTPHDDIFAVELSSEYATDQTLFAISRSLLLRSHDGGISWDRLTNGLDTSQNFSAVGLSPVDPQIVYVASVGVSSSSDGGDSWDPTALTANVDLLEVSTTGAVAAAGRNAQVHVSVDDGATWTPTQFAARVNAIAFDTEVIYAGLDDGTLASSGDGGATWTSIPVTDVPLGSVLVRDDGALLVGTDRGEVLVSTDGGQTFTETARRPGTSRVMSLVADPSDDSVLWAVTADDGPWVTDDEGATWDDRQAGLLVNQQSQDPSYDGREDFSTLRIAPGEESTMFLAGFDGLFRSIDRGGEWVEVQTLDTVIVGFDLSPDFATNPEVVVSTYISGIHRSTDGGESWTPQGENLVDDFGLIDEGVIRLFNVQFSPGYPADQTLYSSTQDEILRSDDGGSTWVGIDPGEERTARTPRIDIVSFSPEFATDGRMFVGTREGVFLISEDRGDTFTVIGDFGAFNRSIAVSPAYATDQTVFISHSPGPSGDEELPPGVYKSVDGGFTFEPTGLQRLGRLAVSPAYADDGVVMLATPAGLFRSADRGETWQGVAIENDRGRDIRAIAMSPDFANDQTVLISVEGLGLMRSVDSGVSFEAIAPTLIENNLLAADFDKPTNKPIKFSPDYASDGTIYVSTVTELVRSTDRGETWARVTPPVSDDSALIIEPVPSTTAADSTSTTPTPTTSPAGGGDGSSGNTTWWWLLGGAAAVAVAAGGLAAARRR